MEYSLMSITIFLILATIEYRSFKSKGHHADQPERYWLHALTVDIPDAIEKYQAMSGEG